MNISSMKSHSAMLDPNDAAAPMLFADEFNVAVAFIDRHVEQGRGGKVAVLSGLEKITYRELAENIARAGNVLKQLGLARGDRIIMVSVDTPDFLYVFWGAIKAGFIPVPVNTQLKDADYQVLIKHSECAMVYVACEEAHAEEALKAARACGLPAARIVEKTALLSAMQSASAQLEPAKTTQDDDCFWLYSSGSTGVPKAAIHVHRDMVITSQRYGADTMGIREDDIVFCASKLFFSYGFGGAMTFPLWVGATTVLCPELPSAEMAFRMIRTYRPTVYFGMPSLYRNQLLYAETHPGEVDMSSIRHVPSAGEAVPEGLYHKWKEAYGLDILDGLGSSEVLHVFISNRPDDIRPGSSGRIVTGYEVKLIDENGATVGPGEYGVVMVKGQSLARAYWHNPEKTAHTMRGEWLYTGDMYVCDSDGYYTSIGRADDMFKVGGMWCSPTEIEDTLLTHSKVREVAVVGQKDQDGLLKPAAYVVLRNQADASEALKEELKMHCKNHLLRYKYPHWFIFTEQLPRTGTGKLQRFALRS